MPDAAFCTCLRNASSGIIARLQPNPGTLKVLLGAIRVMVRLAISGSMDAMGICCSVAQEQIAVDLVGADDQVMLDCNLCHALQFAACVGTTGGVVWIAENEEAGV